jgi:hypothetical protein
LKSKKTSAALPFWEDERTQSSKINSDKIGFFPVFKLGVYALLFIFIVYVLLLTKVSPLVWLCAAYLLIIIVISIYGYTRLRSTSSRVKEIQEKALEITGASVIGSAIHVAGHPLLDRDGPIVIALVDDHLKIYSFEDSSPIDRISIQDIKALKTVVYDDDRIPHTEVIDSAAQALQMEFTWQSKECTCLFRRMRKVRPIDWYHTIQQIRLKPTK